MPELPVKEVRFSELHLPEIKREEIVRSLSEVRLPSVDLPDVERPRIALPDSVRRIDWRSIDVPGALAGLAAIARLGRPVVRRSRWPFAVGAVIVVAGIAAVAVVASRPGTRERAGRAVRDMRTRIETATSAGDRVEIAEDAVVATEPAAGVEAGIEATSEAGREPVEAVGSDVSAVADVIEEAGSPA